MIPGEFSRLLISLEENNQKWGRNFVEVEAKFNCRMGTDDAWAIGWALMELIGLNGKYVEVEVKFDCQIGTNDAWASSWALMELIGLNGKYVEVEVFKKIK